MILDGVRQSCEGETKTSLEELCMKLPAEGDCNPGRIDYETNACDDALEFPCGDGQCVHGLQWCDRKLDCRNGADELRW